MKFLQGTVQFCIATDPFLAIAQSDSETAKTKCSDRENQCFQQSIHLPKTQTHRKRVAWTYWLADYDHPHRWRSPIHKSETQFFISILLTHNLLKFEQRKIRGSSDRHFTKKKASPAGNSWGCEGTKKYSCDEAIPPPGETKSLATISFINPLRFAPIANATTGLIQATSVTYGLVFRV